MKVDVVMPTLNRLEPCLPLCLYSMKEEIPINKFIVMDGGSSDGTVEYIKEFCSENDIDLHIEVKDYNLPEARQKGIEEVETDWFLFLDSDVILCKGFWENLVDHIDGGVGAVNGRKIRTLDPRDPEYVESDEEWVSRRSFRGTTIGTLVRTEAVESIRIPEDCLVWEDEFIRQWVEGVNPARRDSTYFVDVSNGNDYEWVFASDSFFYANQEDSHEKGLIDGRIFARYGFKPAYRVIGKPLKSRSFDDVKVSIGYIMEKIGV